MVRLRRVIYELVSYADGRVSIAIGRVGVYVILYMCLSVCVCACPHDKTKTDESTITKLGTRIVHHDTSPNS